MKFSRIMMLLVFLVSTLSIYSCTGGSVGGGGGGTPTPTSPLTPTPQEEAENEEFIGDVSLCAPGDTAKYFLSANNVARFTLNDETCTVAKDNRKEEYSLILYNTSSADIGFRISSPSDLSPFERTLSKTTGIEPQDSTPRINRIVRESYAIHKALNDPESPLLPTVKQNPSIAVSYTPGDSKEYKIRTHYDDPTIWDSRQAKFMAEGANIEIWVDYDILNDPVIFDPTNTDPLRLKDDDFQDIVDVYENNIYPLANSLLGSACSTEFPSSDCPASDIDNNGKVTVIMTPVLNNLPTTAADQDHAVLPSVYVDTRNLQPETTLNPMSNEQEVIFLYSPDPQGSFNSQAPISVPSYLDKDVFAWLTVGLEKLISYNMHVNLYVSGPEEDWIDYGLGGLLADLAGFNIWTLAVWKWLDDPAYETITTSNEYGCPNAMAGPYLFFLYMMQTQVDDTINNTIDDGSAYGGCAGGPCIDSDLSYLSSFMSIYTGVENMENAIDISFVEDEETEFQALFKNWTVALATSGTNNLSLQTSSEFDYYFVSSDFAGNINDSTYYGTGIAAYDGANYAVSTRYGADGGVGDNNAFGNPVGLDLNNTENFLGDRDPASPYEVLIENPHQFTYIPGNKLFGIVKPFTANFVRITGMLEDITEAVLQSTSSQLQMFLVRKNDLTYPKDYSESIFGSLPQHPEILYIPGPFEFWQNAPYFNANKIDLESSLNADGVMGDVLTIVGRIDKSDTVPVYDEQCNNSFQSVPDTDKYQIYIPDGLLPGDDEGNLAIWIERQADSTDGRSTLDPMLAIVSWDDVPYPSGRYDYSAYDANPITGSATEIPFNQRAEYRYITRVPVPDSEPYESENAAQHPGAGECVGAVFGDGTSPASLPDGSTSSGYGCIWGMSDWTTFGNLNRWPDGIPNKMFEREILKSDPLEPFISSDPLVKSYDPRLNHNLNVLSLDCVPPTVGEDYAVTDQDDFLDPGEMGNPSLFQEQILIEMGRDSAANNEPDTLAVAYDHQDDDTEYYGTIYDAGNNTGGMSVENFENGMLNACDWLFYDCDLMNWHLRNQYSASDDPTDPPMYDPNLRDPGNPGLYLEPGRVYTIIVGGQKGTTGNYEVKIRKLLPERILRGFREVTN